jgi:hypothetical protein
MDEPRWQHLGDWAFTVMSEDGGNHVVTDWSVYDPSTEHLYEGTTEGALPYAILDAYDETGLTCALVIDPDLALMAGLSARKEDA